MTSHWWSIGWGRTCTFSDRRKATLSTSPRAKCSRSWTTTIRDRSRSKPGWTR
uniref:hypothetical protein n=1 Tax=Halobiforma nitratireducens TaxID=130048 RepID=UPI00373AF40E